MQWSKSATDPEARQQLAEHEDTLFGVFSYCLESGATTSYAELCGRFEGSDLVACRTLRAGGICTLIGIVVGLLTSFVLICKVSALIFWPSQNPWVRWMDPCGQLQALALLYSSLVWPLVCHVTLHAFTDAVLHYSWAVTAACCVGSLWCARFWHQTIAARPDGSFNPIPIDDEAAPQPAPAAVVVIGPNGQPMVVQGQPLLVRRGAEPPIALAQPMQQMPRPVFTQPAGQPYGQQQVAQQPFYLPQPQPPQFHLPHDSPPDYNSTAGDSSQEGATQSAGTRALPPQRSYAAVASTDSTTWADVQKSGQR